MLHREDQRGFVLAAGGAVLPAEDEETGEIMLVIFNGAGQYLHAVKFGGALAGDGCSVADMPVSYHLDAAGGIIGRYQLALEVFEKCLALPQCLRM